MEKQYSISVHDKDWSKKWIIKSSWAKSELVSGISFTSSINSSQWEINLVLNRDYKDISIIATDFIKIYIVDINFPTWKLIYTWIVEEINRNYKADENNLELIVRWFWSILNRKYYNTGGAIFTKTDTASNIIKEIISNFNTQFGYTWINDSLVETTVWNITIEIDNTTSFDSMNLVIEQNTDYYFYIDSTWNVIFKLKDDSIISHKFTAKKDLQNLDINEDSSPYIEEDIIKTDTRYKIVLDINTQFVFENIKPWDYIKARNLEYTIEWLQVVRISYDSDICILNLDEYDSAWKILLN